MTLALPDTLAFGAVGRLGTPKEWRYSAPIMGVGTLGGKGADFKSNNLQYNTLVRLADGTNDSSTKRLTFQVFFFIISYRLRALKTLYFHFCNLIKKIKINWKGFCKEFCKILWKNNNTWNIRHLVDNSFVPSAQQTSVLYCRLTDSKWIYLWGRFISSIVKPSFDMAFFQYFWRFTQICNLHMNAKLFLVIVSEQF